MLHSLNFIHSNMKRLLHLSTLPAENKIIDLQCALAYGEMFSKGGTQCQLVQDWFGICAIDLLIIVDCAYPSQTKCSVFKMYMDIFQCLLLITVSNLYPHE